MTLNKKSNRGFTIVELLIVIVVIAILAAISIVAYNGIQDRARNTTAKDSAAQLKTKIGAWQSIEGSYPTVVQVTGGLKADNAPEAEIGADLLGKIAGAVGEVTADKPLAVEVCNSTDATPVQTGMKVTYWQSGGNESIKMGANCAD